MIGVPESYRVTNKLQWSCTRGVLSVPSTKTATVDLNSSGTPDRSTLFRKKVFSQVMSADTLSAKKNTTERQQSVVIIHSNFPHKHPILWRGELVRSEVGPLEKRLTELRRTDWMDRNYGNEHGRSDVCSSRRWKRREKRRRQFNLSVGPRAMPFKCAQSWPWISQVIAFFSRNKGDVGEVKGERIGFEQETKAIRDCPKKRRCDRRSQEADSWMFVKFGRGRLENGKIAAIDKRNHFKRINRK